MVIKQICNSCIMKDRMSNFSIQLLRIPTIFIFYLKKGFAGTYFHFRTENGFRKRAMLLIAHSLVSNIGSKQVISIITFFK